MMGKSMYIRGFYTQTIKLHCCCVTLILLLLFATTTIAATITATSTTTTIILSNSTTTISPSTSTANTNTTLVHHKLKKVCQGVHIRNDLKSFEQLRGCDIIDGPLTIALVSNQTHPYEPKDYEEVTFPQLTEVTDYLLLFRVQGLTTLARLFPNLSVIRGRELVSNYALIIYEMMHLQKINLPKLTDILQGSVHIGSNPNLCYVSTINWEGICKHTFTPHFIKDNNPRCNNRCPEICLPWNIKPVPSIDPTTRLKGDVRELGSENNRSLFCWTNTICQESCFDKDGNSLPLAPDGGCCSPQCAGGCYESDRSDRCITCRSVFQEDKCVEHCDLNLFEHKGRCINETACEMMVETVQSQCSREAPSTTSNFKALRLPNEKHGRCQVSCPKGFEEDPEDKHKCKPCDKGKCRKVCTPDKSFMVTNVDSLRDLSGCNVINGSLEITMKGGKNVLSELETVFQELEEIRGYLKIARSYPIVTLSFLKNLKAINGSELQNGFYSFIIIENPNLQELFILNQSDSNQQKQLKILNGKIFIHHNPRLCPNRIDNLKLYASVADWDERDVSRGSNGDKEACNTRRLDVQFKNGQARVAIVKIENFAKKLDDPRSLLYYLINYREVQNGTVTMFDGLDGCNSQNDKWITTEEAPLKPKGLGKVDDYQDVVLTVKPATRYALYVKTVTISAGSIGALSDIIYFETAPDTPGYPRQIESSASDHNSVIVSWLPPSKPNGKIERYLITITRIHEIEDLQYLDVCDSIVNRDKITQSLTNREPTQSSMIPTNSNTYSSAANNINDSSAISSQTNTCTTSGVDTDPDIQVEQVTLQDTIIDIVYLKQPCIPSRVRRRRSIEHELSATESISENSLPRKLTVDSQTQNRAEPNVDTSFANRSSMSDSRIYPHTTRPIQFIDDKTEANITLTGNEHHDSRLTYTITGLSHFSLYAIEVVACHGEFKGIETKTSKSYNRCSLQAITQVRTKPIPDNDNIRTSSIIFSPANESTSDNFVSWSKPESPNGLLLAYRVRYRPKYSNSEIRSQVCISNTAYNRDGGLALSNIPPGTYLLSVQSVSMYSASDWSEEIEFEIPRASTSALTWVIIIVTCIVILAIGTASGAFFFRKRRSDHLIYASVNPDYVQYEPDGWEVDKEKLLIGEHIGTGSFGMVLKGQLRTEKGMIECAVKTLQPGYNHEQRENFLREASIMKQFDTFHVVKLLGVVSVSAPVYVIMEHMANGDLKDFLRKQRDIHQKQNKTIVDGIYLMAAQIADGMAYLESKKFVHRDLAARNCMVGENQVVKIGDFGLTRDVYVNDYYRRGTHGRLPVRWMAPEALNDNVYTSSADVWSYGIVLWEMVTFSAYPYQGLSNSEVMRRVIRGHSLTPPDNSPDKLSTLMKRCWQINPKKRPTFIEIVEFLLSETEGKLYPNCFYKKPKADGDGIVQTIAEESPNTGIEFVPLLSWPGAVNNHANGLTNGDNHINHSAADSGDKD